MVTTNVDTLEAWRMKKDVWLIRHHVDILVLCCPVWRDPCPPSIQSLLEKGVHNLKCVSFSKLN